MLDPTTLLPTTALVAVVVFVAKEGIETFRRWKSDGRRKKAFRELLARECELNQWAMKSLREIAAELMAAPEDHVSEILSIEYAKSGRIYAQLQSADGSYSKSAVPSIHSDVMKKYLVDIATLDKDLFGLVEPALTACAELEHLRESLLYHGSDDKEARSHIAGFGDYAVREIDKARQAIGALYVACTGKPLNTARLR